MNDIDQARNTPVVAIVFNRPDCSLRLMESLRKLKPTRLFVISDGARREKNGEAALVQQCRDIMKPDWVCDFSTNFAENNMGCRYRVVSGLNWVFEHADEAIILEDDCIPSPAFFAFCSTMLSEYRNDPRVACVCGMRVFSEGINKGEICFSKYPNCWGWATWKRAWRLNLRAVPDSYSDTLKRTFNLLRERIYWNYILTSVRENRINSWYYLWQLTCWSNDSLAVYPPVSLVSNVGAGLAATHTSKLPYYMKACNDPAPLEPRPIRKAHCSFEADRWIEDHMYSKSLKGRALWVADKIGML